jgi:eukaryotic-like serine/threonine-protein kinase
MSPEPTPSSVAFDAARWKRVNEALDQALELTDSDREAYLTTLGEEDATLASEVRRLIERANVPTSLVKTTPTHPTAPLATAVVRPGLTVQLATVFGAASPVAERGFDGLLQRALRADRNATKSARYRGELCGAWRLKSLVGTGGMGEVWLAERADGLYEAQAAVKFLRPNTNTAAFEARFAQERALLARLNHPGIARLIDAGRQFGTPFLVIEYVEGMGLLNYLVEYAPTVEKRLAVFRAIAEAVSYAHSQLVVHRDLKPSNVLVTPGGQVKLLDFGVAGMLQDDDDETTQSAATKIAGRGLTLEYAAPEQVAGDTTGVASDVYSLGALGYHMLCGHRAHMPERSGRAALEHAILHTDPPRLSAAVHITPPDARDNFPPPSDEQKIGPDLDAIFSRAMRREPESRYRTVDELLSDIRRYAERRPISARREERAYRTRLWLRRNWLAAALSTTLLVSLAGGLGFSLWQAERARQEAQRANLTAAYLSELLSGADPDLHGGNWPSVLNLIERAQSDLATKFAGEPSVEQRMSHTIATILRRLSRFQDAYPIAQRSYELSTSLYGDNAEPTRIAGALLADVMYWIDKDNEAVPILEKSLGDKTPQPMPEWWREAFLLRANLIGGLRRIDEAHAGFDKYREFIRGHPLESWLEAESETDRAVLLMTQGRHQESLALHRKYRSALTNPPGPVAKRVSLTNLNNGDVMRLYMGEFEGLEAAFKTNLAEWDRLAGPSNQHSIEAIGRLGLYYFQFDQPQEAMQSFAEKLKRLESLQNRNLSSQLFTRIDLLETETKYFLRPSQAILTDALALEKEVAGAESVAKTTRDRYLQRLALVRVTFGDVGGLAKNVLDLPAPSLQADQRPDRAITRWVATASLLAAQTQYDEACRTLDAATNTWGEQNRVLVAAPLYLRRALFCMLAGSPDTAKHLAIARTSIPDAIPATHRLRRVYEHLERSAYARDQNEVIASQRRLAEALRIPQVADLNPALLGLIF